MGFGQAVRSVFSKYATFSGRARRSEFWWWQLFSFLVLLPFGIVFFVTYMITIFSFLDATDAAGDVDGALVNWVPMVVGGIIYTVAALALLLPSYAVLVRRLHDMGQPGWWVLLALVGLSIVALIMSFFDSEARPNQWGADPKAGERVQPPGGHAAQANPLAGDAAQGYAVPPDQRPPPPTPHQHAQPPASPPPPAPPAPPEH